MALDIPPPSVDRFRLHPVETASCIDFLFCASDVLASFALACATPFQRSPSLPQRRYRCASRGR